MDVPNWLKRAIATRPDELPDDRSESGPWISFVGESVYFHPSRMNRPGRYFFHYDGVEYIAIRNEIGGVDVVKAEDLLPKTIPCVTNDNWWIVED
jgi:hypothetical protein